MEGMSLRAAAPCEHCADKGRRARKIVVIAETSTIKDGFGCDRGASFRVRPKLVSLLAQAAFKHTKAMPCGLVSLADSIAQFLGAKPAYHPEQLHLYEFVAYEINRFNDSLDLDLLVRKKPFREEKEGHLANDVESDEREIRTERQRA